MASGEELSCITIKQCSTGCFILRDAKTFAIFIIYDIKSVLKKIVCLCKLSILNISGDNQIKNVTWQHRLVEKWVFIVELCVDCSPGVVKYTLQLWTRHTSSGVTAGNLTLLFHFILITWQSQSFQHTVTVYNLSIFGCDSSPRSPNVS